MPRPERPIDASLGPVQEFAAALRKLRADAGGPPYREMAGRAHVSKASLSAAASGHRLPTWEVARGYVTVCGGDVHEWHNRWEETRATVRPATSTVTASVPRPADALRRLLPRRPRPRRAVLASVVVVVLLAAGAWLASRNSDGVRAPLVAATQGGPDGAIPTPSGVARFVGGSEPLADNADPKKTGCAADPASVTTIDSVEVNTLNENLLGVAELRHAPSCRASWGRFTASDRLAYLSGPIRITITAHRPATGTVGTPYTTPYDGQPAFGNILLDTMGCVEVTIAVEAPGGNAVATTACRR